MTDDQTRISEAAHSAVLTLIEAVSVDGKVDLDNALTAAILVGAKMAVIADPDGVRDVRVIAAFIEGLTALRGGE